MFLINALPHSDVDILNCWKCKGLTEDLNIDYFEITIIIDFKNQL